MSSYIPMNFVNPTEPDGVKAENTCHLQWGLADHVHLMRQEISIQKPASWRKKQLFPFWKQLPPMAKNAPDGRVLKSDTAIGKNYLSEDEIRRLERTVSGFFDYIEGIIERRQSFTMESFAESVNKFLTFNEYQVLVGDYGKISRQQTKARAFTEYEKFNETQRIESDFDRIIKEIEKKLEGRE